MHQSFGAVLTCAFLLASSTSAAPTDNNQFAKVSREPTGNLKTKNGILQVEKTYRKYGWPLPEKLAESADAVREKITTTSTTTTGIVQKIAQQQHQGTVGSVSANPQQYNSEYLCPITIGGQRLNLNLDTGSSDLWVYNPAIPSNQHAVYDPSKSKTYSAASDLSFSLSYGDKSSISGTVARDTVQLGGLVVEDQAIELPNSVSASLSSDSSDGILGLGFQSINSIKQGNNDDPQPTWFENVMGQLVNPLFTVNLKAGMAGYYKFGQVDNTAFKDNTMWYTKVDNTTQKGYWGFESTQYAIGSGSTQQNLNNNSIAIADTGASVFFVNPAPYDAFYANVKGKSYDSSTGMTTFPCSETLPDFHVSLGSQLVTIPGHMLNYMPDTAKGPNGEDMCVGGIQSNGNNPPQVYGDILFELYFAVFDYGNMQIGFAPHA